jgi:hypothetical protein
MVRFDNAQPAIGSLKFFVFESRASAGRSREWSASQADPTHSYLREAKRATNFLECNGDGSWRSERMADENPKDDRGPVFC